MARDVVNTGIVSNRQPLVAGELSRLGQLIREVREVQQELASRFSCALRLSKDTDMEKGLARSSTSCKLADELQGLGDDLTAALAGLRGLLDSCEL